MLIRGDHVMWSVFVVIVAVTMITIFTTFGSNNTITGLAIEDCVDLDGDGYLDEKCTVEDLACGAILQYVTDPNQQETVDVYDNILVFKDDRDGDKNIYLYDTTSMVTTQVSSSTRPDLNPQVFGDYIVWQTSDSLNWDIMRYSISTGTIDAIVTDSNDQVSPSVSGNYIVWSDFRNGNYDIYGYDLSTNTELSFVTSSADQSIPKVNGNYIVYVENNEIYYYTISTGTITRVTSSSSIELAPEIHGDYIVWQTDKNGNWDIQALDLTDPTETIIDITSVDGDQRLPTVYGDIIVFMDDRNGNLDIMYHDLSTGTKGQLTDNIANQMTPVIWESTVYWNDFSSGNFDILGTVIDPICNTLLGDCNDNDNLVFPGSGCEEEVVIEELNVTEDLNETFGVECEFDSDCDLLYGEGFECVEGFCSVSAECLTDSDCEILYGSSFECVDSFCSEPPSDCASLWDCSNVGYGECVNGIQIRDLNNCIHPDISVFPECWEEEFLPSAAVGCLEEPTVVPTVEEEVPFFSWFNIVLVIFLLIGFYAWKKD